MSIEKPYKKVVEELKDEIESLKYTCTRLSDAVEVNNKISSKMLETQLDIASSLMDVMKQFTIINADNEKIQELLKNLSNNIDKLQVGINKLDDSTWRLSEALKKQSKAKEESERKRDFLIKKILEKVEE
jgi:phosphotransferase system IIB component